MCVGGGEHASEPSGREKARERERERERARARKCMKKLNTQRKGGKKTPRYWPSSDHSGGPYSIVTVTNSSPAALRSDHTRSHRA